MSVVGKQLKRRDPAQVWTGDGDLDEQNPGRGNSYRHVRHFFLHSNYAKTRFLS
jgi:hypothetical protein